MGFTFLIRHVDYFKSFLYDVVDVEIIGSGFFFCLFFTYLIFFLLALGKRCRNWENFVVGFYWITFNNFFKFLKTDIYCCKIDISKTISKKQELLSKHSFNF